MRQTPKFIKEIIDINNGRNIETWHLNECIPRDNNVLS